LTEEKNVGLQKKSAIKGRKDYPQESPPGQGEQKNGERQQEKGPGLGQ